MIAMDELTKTLQLAGRDPVIVGNAGKGHIVVLPYGGRVLGLFAPGDDQNFLWVNPALGGSGRARSFYQSKEWHNSGGDRTWLGPEIDFFLPDYPDTSRYWQQRELDPGEYHLVETGSGVRLVNKAKLMLYRSKVSVKVEIAKSITPISNPLRHDCMFDQGIGHSYAGYSLRTELTLVEGDESVDIGIWNLLQLPHGGTAFAPIVGNSPARVLLGNVSSRDLRVENGLVRFAMRAEGLVKIALRAVSSTGRIGYVYLHGGTHTASLVIRNFSVNPSAEYVDVPWNNEKEMGYSTQICNVNNEMGAFSELEYHVPAIGRGIRESTDVSQVWAFRGTLDEIEMIARTLLSETCHGLADGLAA